MTLKSMVLKVMGSGLNLTSLLFPRWGGQLAFRLFSTPPKPRIRPKEAVFLSAADRMDCYFENKKIAVYSWGDPSHPYVFMAYGWAYNAGRWRYFVPPLVAAGYRVIAFDPPGHGYSDPGLVEYPLMVRLQRQLIQQFGAPSLFLGHSFGGGCFVGTLTSLPRSLHPERICLMGVFSEARWIFHNYRQAMGLSRRTYLRLINTIYRRTGYRLSSFDNARQAADLGHLPCLLIHDPEDQVVSFSNALRNHQYWPNSALYRPIGAGHHLGTKEVTQTVMAWLLEGQLPTDVTISSGLTDAKHELRAWFLSVEQDTIHGRMSSQYYA
ncbi:MAG: alpha/beta fold hydrolase [Bacteroidota bacterium]